MATKKTLRTSQEAPKTFEEVMFGHSLDVLGSNSRKSRDVIDCESSLSAFIQSAWHVIEPNTTYLHNWHVDLISEHLEAVTLGQLRRVIFNIPPRYMKSIQVSVCWPVWWWIKNPSMRFLCVSYSDKLALEHSGKGRSIVRSDWYQKNWGAQIQIASDHDKLSDFANTRGGHRQATSVGGSSTGLGGECLIFDDPMNPREAASKLARKTANDWIRDSFLNRLNDKKKGVIVGVMQRLNEQDTTGMLEEMGGWTIVKLPSVAEERTVISFPRSLREIIREPGDLLFPDREGPEEIAEQRTILREYGFSGQYQQNPSPQEGGLLKRYWWRFWYPSDLPTPQPITVKKEDGTEAECVQIPLPTDLTDHLHSWDMAFKETESSDFVVGQAWAKQSANKFLLGQTRARMDFPKSMQAVKNLKDLYPEAQTILIEDKANGSAVISSLQNEISGIIPVNPEGGKEARVNAVSSGIESGNVYLPHPQYAQWVNSLIEEASAFPKATHDDQVDAMTQALTRYINTDYAPMRSSVNAPRPELQMAQSHIGRLGGAKARSY